MTLIYIIHSQSHNARETMNNKIKLLLIGPIPEPIGGVSIHITRLSDLLEDHFTIKYIDESPNIKHGVFNIRSLNIIKYIKSIIWADIIHIHSGVTLLRVLHITISKLLNRETIVTMHSLSHQTPTLIKINSYILKLADKVILVSKEIEDSLKVNSPIIKEAFIPPRINNEPELPGHISQWIDHQRKHKRTILSANASKITLHNNMDLYGFDLCIDALAYLVNNQNLNLCLILIIGTQNNPEDILESYKATIEKHHLEDRILLSTDKLSFVKIIAESDIVLRPTCTDGDALTIREAIFLNKVIIASDVVKRPPGTVTFKNRDNKDLITKIYNSMPEAVTNLSNNNNQNTEDYLSFYKNIYNT